MVGLKSGENIQTDETDVDEHIMMASNVPQVPLRSNMLQPQQLLVTRSASLPALVFTPFGGCGKNGLQGPI